MSKFPKLLDKGVLFYSDNRLSPIHGIFPHLNDDSTVVIGVELQRESALFELRQTGCRLRPLPRLIQRRQQHTRQYRDDRNHNKKFNKCKCRFSRHRAAGFERHRVMGGRGVSAAPRTPGVRQGAGAVYGSESDSAPVDRRKEKEPQKCEPEEI